MEVRSKLEVEKSSQIRRGVDHQIHAELASVKYRLDAECVVHHFHVVVLR